VKHRWQRRESATRTPERAVSGTNKGKQFLARTLTGVGTVAAFAVGRPGGFSLSGPVDNSILLRERIAQNVGIAGEQELMNLAISQDVVVTVPGNTRFFLVISGAAAGSGNRSLGSTPRSGGQTTALAPTAPLSLAEIRELVALKQELNRLNRESTTDRIGQAVR